MKKKRGIRPFLWRILFRSISLFYSLGVRTNRFFFDHGLKRVHRLDVPVISVGNLSLGGTGKSPMVAWLVRAYLNQGKCPGVLSRGYKSENFGEKKGADAPFQRQNDEAAELAMDFPAVPYYLSPNRYEAGRALLKANRRVDLLILDDAFQHRRLARDLDVVLLDSLDPFGTGRLFPAGFLREPISSLKRADVILLSRADLISEVRRAEIRRHVRKFAPNALWGETAVMVTAVVRYGVDGRLETLPSNYPVSSPALPFCGIGNPDGFFKMLKMNRFSTVEGLSFPDHARLTENDLIRLAQAADDVDARGFLTTMKDLVKLRRSEIAGLPVWGIKIGLKFLAGETEFLDDLSSKGERG